MLGTAEEFTWGSLALFDDLVLFCRIRNPSAHLTSNIARMNAIHAARPDFNAAQIVPCRAHFSQVLSVMSLG